ncbi:DnaA/Hda family protein [Singulisphaera sp. Ch08]|uniref:Chromosomal replication initiator protein DnaA n=1 Tax=Singulisphaera sp. Ch08 TaxID=3120278 RepID=A0AAU7CJD7_9BACT
MDFSSLRSGLVPAETVPPHPWDGFLTGPENDLAHASVLALARGDGPGLSPLVLHGPAGVGKSRLLTGLVSERLLRHPESAVAHMEAEAFAAACAEAAGQNGGWVELRSRFRGLDLFVLEDLHTLERAPLALTELTHTLDALDEAGASVAVSARVGPGQWSGWPPRLVNRLVGGLAVRVDPPGLASRRRYLLDRARARKINLLAEAVDSLAEAADGYRTLDGWLAKLALESRVERKPLDRRLVTPLVDGEATDPALTIDQIARAVAAKFGVSLRDLRSSTRRKTIAEPRHLAMHLARSLTSLSFQAIGTYFGGRDSATVRHACKAAAARLAADPALASATVTLARRWSQGDTGGGTPSA